MWVKASEWLAAEWRVNGAVVDGEGGGNGWDVTVGGRGRCGGRWRVTQSSQQAS